jgi:hypothetical protein
MSDIELWQQALAAEHAAIYGYGLVGAVDGLADRASRSLAVHRQRRTWCMDSVVALGGVPEASAPAYDIAMPADPDAAAETAAALEAACWPGYAGLCSSADRPTRLTGAGWLRQSAVHAVSWSGAVPPLPGLDT